MFAKLLKNDLKKNMRWLWILFVATIAVAGVDRACKELAENFAVFKIFAILFDSVFYALLVNVILQPFLRNFMNFSKSLYGDESYLTHTLPVTKNQIINSKFLTAIIEITITEILASQTDFFSESLTPKVSCTRFCEILEAAAKSCESTVDIVDAKIPARMIPAVNAGITPNLLKNFEISTIIVSAAEALS